MSGLTIPTPQGSTLRRVNSHRNSLVKRKSLTQIKQDLDVNRDENGESTGLIAENVNNIESDVRNNSQRCNPCIVIYTKFGFRSLGCTLAGGALFLAGYLVGGKFIYAPDQMNTQQGFQHLRKPLDIDSFKQCIKKCVATEESTSSEKPTETPTRTSSTAVVEKCLCKYPDPHNQA